MVRGLSSLSFDSFSGIIPTMHVQAMMKNGVSIDFRNHFFTERVINTRNSLDEITVALKPLNCFKKNLEKIKTKLIKG